MVLFEQDLTTLYNQLLQAALNQGQLALVSSNPGNTKLLLFLYFLIVHFVQNQLHL